MDIFKAYDTRAAAEEAREMELRNQQTGEVITSDGKPCIVLVKGMSARSIQAELRKEGLARAKKAKAAANADGEVDTSTAEDLHEATCKAAGRLIAGFRNIQTADEDGKPRDLGAGDIAAFLDLNFISVQHLTKDADAKGWTKPSFAQQVLDFAQDDAAFLTKLESA